MANPDGLPAAGDAAPSALPSVSIVIPAYNEADRAGRVAHGATRLPARSRCSVRLADPRGGRREPRRNGIDRGGVRSHPPPGHRAAAPAQPGPRWSAAYGVPCDDEPIPRRDGFRPQLLARAHPAASRQDRADRRRCRRRIALSPRCGGNRCAARSTDREQEREPDPRDRRRARHLHVHRDGARVRSRGSCGRSRCTRAIRRSTARSSTAPASRTRSSSRYLPRLDWTRLPIHRQGRVSWRKLVRTGCSTLTFACRLLSAPRPPDDEPDVDVRETQGVRGAAARPRPDACSRSTRGVRRLPDLRPRASRPDAEAGRSDVAVRRVVLLRWRRG